MYEKEKRELLDAALTLKAENLIKLSGGNVSMRTPNGDMIITPSGMDYEKMVLDDFVVFDRDENIIEGVRKPSVDSPALFYIFRHMKDVNAIIHTHQPYATAVGLIEDKLPVVTTTLSNVTLGEVSVAPFSSPADVSMGEETVKYANGKRAVILKHHGVVTIGETLKEALYAAIYLETSAQTYLLAKAVREPDVMTEEQNAQAVEVFKNYGQK